VAEAIADKVEVTVTGKERTRLVAARPVSPEAYESTLKGWHNNWNSEADIEKSIGYFQDAIKIDPTYALPYLGLGSAYMAQGSIMIGDSPQEAHQKTVSAVQKALELDPELAGAHLLLGDVKQKQYQWADAEAEYKRTLELAPNDAEAHFALADWFSSQGHPEEALAWARRRSRTRPTIGVGRRYGLDLLQCPPLRRSHTRVSRGAGRTTGRGKCPLGDGNYIAGDASTATIHSRAGKGGFCFEW